MSENGIILLPRAPPKTEIFVHMHCDDTQYTIIIITIIHFYYILLLYRIIQWIVILDNIGETQD